MKTLVPEQATLAGPPAEIYGKAHLLVQVDCCQDHPAGRYFSRGTTRVVQAGCGGYREAEPCPLARFGYRFEIENVGRPHLLTLRYPDDKRRFMIINDGTTYDLSTGVITGHAVSISGGMCELRQVFWPRWKDCSICFSTWGFDEPAAVAEFAIHELTEGLPALSFPAKSVPFREVAIQYEDPCGTGLSEGAVRFETWLDRLVEYAKHTGTNAVSYPLCWYHGPLFPCPGERADAFSLIAGPDRKQYIAWTDHPPDWPSLLLSRFEEEDLQFEGVLTLLRLSSLMEKSNTDLAGICRGEETINNLLWNGEVQAGAMDWTCVYNTLNYPELLKRPDPLNANADFPFAYGEKTRQQLDPARRYHAGPIFNPLHPVVQKAVLDFVSEIAGRYGKFRSFRGVAITLWAPTLLWFGSLHAGYDDYTVALFEKETGMRVPGEAASPDRFAQRYEFLVFQARKIWIDWRCQKIRDFICSIRDVMRQARPDLMLTLNLWSEAFVPGILGSGEAGHQLGNRQSTVDLYKEAGLDVALLQGENNIRLDLELDGGGRDRSPSGYGPDAPLESFFMYRDHDFLDEKTLAAVKAHPGAGAFIFNAWHEAWGDHRWFPCEPGDRNQSALAEVYGQKTTEIFRINSEYPEDGFWWDSQLRISSAFPPAPHFLEQYAHALGELDACRISRGGLFLDKCHGEEMREFALAYRSLPAVNFENVGTAQDPVAVRTACLGDVRYLYLVNREYYPLRVEISISTTAGQVNDVVSGEVPVVNGRLVLTLKPFQLRTLTMTAAIAVQGSAVLVPEEVRCAYAAAADEAFGAVRQARTRGHFSAGLRTLAEGIDLALKDGRWAWLRHALTSYPISKCRQLAGQPPFVPPSFPEVTL